MKTNLKSLLASIVTATAVSAVPAAQSASYQANSWTGPTHIFTVNAYTNFAESVKTTSNGELDFEVHVGGSLLPVKSALEGVRDGVADLGGTVAAYVPADLPLNNVVNDVAFNYSDAMVAAFATTELHFNNAKLQAEWQKNGVVYGGSFSTPYYIFACMEPLRSVADAKGRKIRTVGAVTVEWVKSIGGIPVSVPFTDVYTGLERGSLDCVMLDPTNLGSGFKIWEVAKSLTMLTMGTHVSGAQWFYNESMWQDLSEKHRRLLLDEMAVALVKTQMDYEVQTDTALDGSKQRGLEIVQPDSDLVDALDLYRADFMDVLPQTSMESRGIADPTSTIGQFLKLHKKWTKLLNDVDRNDEKVLVSLVRREIYDRVNEVTYGR